MKEKLVYLELGEAAKEFVKSEWLPVKAIEIIKDSLSPWIDRSNLEYGGM